MDFSQAMLHSAGVVTGLMLLTWFISVRRRNVGLVDIAWGLGFVLIAWTLLLSSAPTPRRWLLAALTSIWGLRLSIYLAWRNIGKPEDFRYARMRTRHLGRFALLSLCTVFLLQGVVMLIVALPLLTGMTAQANAPLDTLTWAGCAFWFAGLAFEAGGDWQLARFRANPANAGRVLRSGFWRYTRHPNYFGDFLIWWGLYFVAFGDGTAWWAAIGPIVMSIFLMRVSGVTLLERSLSRKPGYAEDIAATNAFFPWFPRHRAASEEPAATARRADPGSESD